MVMPLFMDSLQLGLQRGARKLAKVVYDFYN